MDFTELLADYGPQASSAERFREEVFSQPLSKTSFETSSDTSKSDSSSHAGLRLVAQAEVPGEGEEVKTEKHDESDMFAIDPELKKAHELMDSTVEHLKSGDWKSAWQDFYETQKHYEQYYNNNPTTDPVELENRRRSNEDRARLATCIRNKLEWRGEQAQVDQTFIEATKLEVQAEAFRQAGMHDQTRQAILEARQKYTEFFKNNPPTNEMQEREKAHIDKRVKEFDILR